MTFVLSALAVGFLIFIHELGHLLVARWVGLPVIRFSIGMGPVILRRDAWGLEWAVSAIPFGGYVLFDGESEAYQEAPAMPRILTSLAGPAANVVAGLILYVLAETLTSGGVALGAGMSRFVDAFTQVFTVLGLLMSGEVGISDLAGPVQMVSMGSSLAAEPGRFAAYMGFISVNLAVFNLLPIPALDGGQILITILQGVSGKTLSERAQTVIFGGSFVLLGGLLVWVVFKDVSSLLA